VIIYSSSSLSLGSHQKEKKKKQELIINVLTVSLVVVRGPTMISGCGFACSSTQPHKIVGWILTVTARGLVDEDNSTNPLTSNDRVTNQSGQVRLTDGRVLPPSSPLLAPTGRKQSNTGQQDRQHGVAGRAHVVRQGHTHQENFRRRSVVSCCTGI
jgi:hypothetical protein